MPGTRAPSAEVVGEGRVRIKDHKLTGKPAVATCPGHFIRANPGEKDEEDLEDKAAGKIGADGLRRSFRNKEPEQEDAAISKLKAAYSAQAVAELGHIDLSCRRRPQEELAAIAQEQRAKQRAAAKVVHERVKEKSAASSSSSSLSSPPSA